MEHLGPAVVSRAQVRAGAGGAVPVDAWHVCGRPERALGQPARLRRSEARAQADGVRLWRLGCHWGCAAGAGHEWGFAGNEFRDDSRCRVTFRAVITRTERPIVFGQTKMPTKRINKTSRGESDISLYKNAYDEVKLRTSLRQAKENDQQQYLIHYADVYFGLSAKEVRKLAFELAVKYGLNTPSTWLENKMAGEEWFHSFMKGNPELSVRAAQATSVSQDSFKLP
ncbi:hypothetical protein EVAR_65647_1 [Eumeta japonica]|uniref:HTH CENPB-type domain-containing protein n=1 Tax=Eumeta variegata TaxID=151549 RepID=A0A4C1Z9G9_EUMVA|nr:hypothetical protein EVAR_65647_1 [Eumeta japonica]